MRYRQIIDFEREPKEGRLARLAVMYGVDDADDDAQAAETELTRAKAARERAEAVAAVARMEAEYDDLAFAAEQAMLEAILTASIPTSPLVRPSSPNDHCDEADDQ